VKNRLDQLAKNNQKYLTDQEKLKKNNKNKIIITDIR